MWRFFLNHKCNSEIIQIIYGQDATAAKCRGRCYSHPECSCITVHLETHECHLSRMNTAVSSDGVDAFVLYQEMSEDLDKTSRIENTVRGNTEPILLLC